MLFSIINYGMLVVFGLGAFICYVAKSQSGHILYKYGFWSFGLFFVSRLISIIQLLLLSPGLGRDIAARDPLLITGINISREILIAAAFIILVIGFYKSFEKEKPSKS